MIIQVHPDIPVIISIFTTAADVAPKARVFALQAEGWIFESASQHIEVVKNRY